jgi:hypothetical protein
MPPSRKDRCSQAWWTFIRNQAITIVQGRSFNEHNWARDLLSRVRSQSCVFTYRPSAFVVASVTGPSFLAVWYTVHPLLFAVAGPRVWFYKIVSPATKSTALACRYPPAGREAGLLTMDRIRDPPTTQELKRHANRSSMRSIDKCVSFTCSTRSLTTTSSTNCPYSQTAIARIGLSS